VKYGGDVRGEIFFETPKYEGKTAKTPLRAEGKAQKERELCER
jgi:hypothetical protein